MHRPALALALCASLTLGAQVVPPGSVSADTLNRAVLADSVRSQMRSAWNAYRRSAWGHDELRPVSRMPRDWYGTSLVITPVDALDALLLMGLKDEAAEARALIHQRLSFDQDTSVKVFEVTIRLMGGLLSGYQMTGDPHLLELADDLGTRLLPAFSSPTGMPYVYVNLHNGRTSESHSNPAEIGTLLLEFGTLSKLTGKRAFFDRPKHALLELARRRSAIGLVGAEIDVETGKWLSTASHVGGGIDSYYEYLLKAWRLFGDRDCERLWRESHRALNAYLSDDTLSTLWYGEADMNTGRRTATEFGALHAFLPGVLALGGDLNHARRLQEACLKMWELYGIEPEVLDYRTLEVRSPGYPLRPEIIESAYVLYRTTGDPRYLEMGRTFFSGLIRRCRADSAYTTLRNVMSGEQGDLMPSYFLAETLKYLYLLFAPATALDFEHVVLTTEAHPLRRTW